MYVQTDPLTKGEARPYLSDIRNDDSNDSTA